MQANQAGIVPCQNTPRTERALMCAQQRMKCQEGNNQSKTNFEFGQMVCLVTFNL